MNYTMSVEQIKEAIRDRLAHTFAVSLENATDEEYYKASALIVRELLAKGRSEFVQNAEKTGTKQIYYLRREVLLGRSLRNNLCHLGLEENFRKALADYGIKLDNLYEQEPDAGLGNGGLGRLAACFMDGLATQGYPAMGYSLRYEYGLFRQKLVDGWQTELPDTWLPGGGIWPLGGTSRAPTIWTRWRPSWRGSPPPAAGRSRRRRRSTAWWRWRPATAWPRCSRIWGPTA